MLECLMCAQKLLSVCAIVIMAGKVPNDCCIQKLIVEAAGHQLKHAVYAAIPHVY